jgi:hypothetical protein
MFAGTYEYLHTSHVVSSLEYHYKCQFHEALPRFPIGYSELRVQLLIFFFMYMTQVIKCANSRRIKLEKERTVRLKRRKIQQRCRINRFKKLMLRRRKLFFCILMNLTSHSVNREIWVKPRGTDIYNDILNWTE